jgi:hypothetical protein
MNFRDHFPIKWKLSLALIATGLSLVLIYVVIANRVFESDKISYVFESQSSMLNSLRREIDGRLEQALLSSQSLLATLDATGKMPLAAQNCPSVFIQQLNTLTNFLPAYARVRSFFVPYFSESTDAEIQVLYKCGVNYSRDKKEEVILTHPEIPGLSD